MNSHLTGAYALKGFVKACLAAAGLALLAGCGSNGVPPPIVDMRGVDIAQHNLDLQDCYRTMPDFSWGNPVTKCMAAKGYKILVP